MNYTVASAVIATSTCYCDRAPVLVDPLLLKFESLGVLCKVQLMSKELELDAYDVPVPKDCKLIELMVLDDSKETIEQIIASTPDYQGYKVTDYWQVIDDENLF